MSHGKTLYRDKSRKWTFSGRREIFSAKALALPAKALTLLPISDIFAAFKSREVHRHFLSHE